MLLFKYITVYKITYCQYLCIQKLYFSSGVSLGAMPVNRFGQHIVLYHKAGSLLKVNPYLNDMDSHIRRILIQDVKENIDQHIKSNLQPIIDRLQHTFSTQEKAYSIIQLSSNKIDKDGFLVFTNTNNTVYTLRIPRVHLNSVNMNIKGAVFINGKQMNDKDLPVTLANGDVIKIKKSSTEKSTPSYVELILVF